MSSCRLTKRVKNKFGLMVSIPVNHPDMARAAARGGADAIKVHVNVSHFASGTDFGTWQQERDNIRQVIEAVDIPVGLLPGAEVIATLEEVSNAKKMGIDFLDAFAHYMPVELWSVDGLGGMIAVNRDYTPRQVSYLKEMGADLVEATLLTHDRYRKDLTLEDLTLYRQLAESTSLPVYVPTQKKIRPGELHQLAKAGVKGIVIGAVVTGKTPDSLEKVTGAFAREAAKILI